VATPSRLDLHVFRFRLHTAGTVRFGGFPGPVLRGALGESREVYARLFAPPPALPQKRFADPPRPVTLRPRFGAGVYGPDSVLELDMTLVGNAGAALPAVMRALVQLGRDGIGEGRGDSPDAGRFSLDRVDALGPCGAIPVVTPEGLFHPVRAPWRFPDEMEAEKRDVASVRLELVSPTFINRRGEPRGTLAFSDLVDDLLRRVSLLSQAYGGGTVYTREEEGALLEAAQDVEAMDSALRWTEVERYSRRQHGPMTFGGWMGWVEYAADPAPWMPLLRAAPLLHVGKHTAFGFGEIRLAP
jgi:hypothetical protein